MMKKIVFLFITLLCVNGIRAEVVETRLTATFGTPATGGSYTSETSTYSWTNESNNLMDVFTLAADALKSYNTLIVTFSGITGDSTKEPGIRIGYYLNEDDAKFHEFVTGGYFKNGTKVIDLRTLGDHQGNVVKIAIGGCSSNQGCCTLKASDVYLTNHIIVAHGDAMYNTDTKVYTWWNGTNNLMDVLTFSSGELNNSTTLRFTIGDFSVTGENTGVRLGYYVGEAFTEKDGFYKNGEKTVDLVNWRVDLSTVTKIVFGGKNGAGSCKIDFESSTLSNDALIREFTVSQQATVCLPFSLTADEATAAGTFYTLTSVTASSVQFTEVAAPQAYTPYLFVPKVQKPFNGLTKSVESPVGKTCETAVSGGTFKGVLASGSVPKDTYGIYNGAFTKAGDNVTIKAFRAYITTSSGARSLDIDLGDGTTGIEKVKNVGNKYDSIYNLSGQSVSPNYKGIVIKNGKKMIQK